MSRGTSSSSGLIALAWLALSLSGSPARPAEFSAKVEQKGSGQDATGTIHVKGDTYRMTLRQDALVVVLIARAGAETTTIAAPAVKAWAELANDHPMVLANDPFRAVRQPPAGAAWEAVGTEALAGYECERSVLRLDGKDVMSRWVAAKLGFPLRVVIHGPRERSIELSSVRERELPDSLFRMPADYEKVEFAELGKRVRAASTARKPKKPAERKLRSMLAAESRWLLAIVPGTPVTVELAPFGQGATWFARSIVDGKPLADLAACTHQGKGTVSLPANAEPSIVEIGVEKGDGSVVVVVAGDDSLRWAKQRFPVQAGSSVTRSLFPPGATVAVRVTGATGGGSSKVSLGFTRTDARGGKRNEPAVVSLADTEMKSWSFTAEENLTDFHATSLHGRVEVLIEQRFKAAAAPSEVASAAKELAPDEEPPPPEPKTKGPKVNVLAATSGTKVIFATSQYDARTWAAANLIDGELGQGHQYCSRTSGPQDIVFALPRPAVVESVVVDPYTTETAPNWAKDVEVWGSTTSPHSGFVKLAGFRLANERGDQAFPLAPTPVRWVSLRLLSSWGGSYIEAGEARIIGSFFEATPPPPRVNVLAAAAGAKVVRCSSEYDHTTWAAGNLIDGALGSGKEYCSASASPVEIVFALPRPVRIAAVAFNPSTSETATNWAREVEVLLATAAQLDGAEFESVGKFTLDNRPHVDPTLRPPDQEFAIEPTEARLVKLRIDSNHGGTYLQMGEFKVYAEPPTP